MKIKLILILLLFLNNIAFAKTKFEKRFDKDLNKISKLNSFVDNEGNPYELDDNIDKNKTIILIAFIASFTVLSSLIKNW